MFFNSTDKTTEATPDSSDNLLNTCEFTVSTDGFLRIRPLGAVLTIDRLAKIIGRLCDSDGLMDWKDIVFDLGLVEVIGPRWTVLLAMIINFARSVTARCRLVSLNGQPAAAAALYRHNTELRELIASGNEA